MDSKGLKTFLLDEKETKICRQIYVSRTKCKIRAVVATRSTSVLLLSRCTRAPTERHSSPVEAVLTGSGATLPGLVDMPKSPVGHSAID